MKVLLIAALDENGVLGSGCGIPWDLPRDRHHFREISAGRALLLGRKTFEEMNGWFTTQRPIVMTRDPGYTPPDPPSGFCVATSVGAALEAARLRGEVDLLVSGGAQIYQLALPFADELLLTEVHAEFEGSVVFPSFSAAEWEETARQRFEADAENAQPMSFVKYRRRLI